MTHYVVHNYLPKKRKTRDLTGAGMRPAIIEVSKANSKAIGLQPGFYYDDGKQTNGPFKLRSMAVEAAQKKENRQPQGPNRALLRDRDKLTLGDYMPNMLHFGCTAEWPDGRKTNLYTMAEDLGKAKKALANQQNLGGWPKLTNFRQVTPSVPAEKKKKKVGDSHRRIVIHNH
jgi:hypothetical protein